MCVLCCVLFTCACVSCCVVLYSHFENINVCVFQLPVVMRVPQLFAVAQNLCMTQFSILGYGDIIIPGEIVFSLMIMCRAEFHSGSGVC